MRHISLFALFALVLLNTSPQRAAYADDQDHVDADYKHAPAKALEARKDLKFGLRIPWGVYSIWADGPESWPLTKHPLDWQGRYSQLYQNWNPTGFDADAWADMMARDGLKFFVMTAKHHDGFSMYNTSTKVSKRFTYTGPNAGKIEDCDLHYSIMESPFKRDVVKEIIDAGRKRGIKPGDWIVSNLVDIVAKGGFFMVGIGPDGDGRFHPKAIESLGANQ